MYSLYSIGITAGGGAALMFAVKLAKNFEIFFQKILFVLKIILKSFQHRNVWETSWIWNGNFNTFENTLKLAASGNFDFLD